MTGKTIVICFDGTGNDMNPDDKKDEDLTNVAKVAELLVSNETQKIIYVPGIATRKNAIKNSVQYAIGNGIRENMKETERVFTESYEPGDSVAVFGFSRGAATARGFVNQLADAKKYDPPIGVKFLGLWDTVKFSINFLIEQSIPESVERTFHLVSIDEQRVPFRPVLVSHSDRTKEVWFAGDHADVGGGRLDNKLSNITLRYMIGKAETHGLSFQSWQNRIVDIGTDRVHTYTGGIPTESRQIRVENSSDHAPIIHESVVQQVQAGEYNPANLRELNSIYTIDNTND